MRFQMRKMHLRLPLHHAHHQIYRDEDPPHLILWTSINLKLEEVMLICGGNRKIGFQIILDTAKVAFMGIALLKALS